MVNVILSTDEMDKIESKEIRTKYPYGKQKATKTIERRKTDVACI